MSAKGVAMSGKDATMNVKDSRISLIVPQKTLYINRMGDDRGRRHMHIKYHLVFVSSRAYAKCMVLFGKKIKIQKVKLRFV